MLRIVSRPLRSLRPARLLLALCLLLPALSLAYEPGRLSFSVEVKDVQTPYREFGIYVLPGERVTLAVADAPGGAAFTARAAAGQLTPRGARSWQWQAPQKPGLYPLAITQAASGETLTLNAFVTVPASRLRKGVLNGYRIGNYPKHPLNGLPAYLPPEGFIELTKANADTPVSPHFRLGQFASKQAGGYPKYLVLEPRLLMKLEMLLEEVNRAGIAADSFVVMSGYRTPAYNRALGNVRYSYHQWGGAADIYIDQAPRDGLMDDVNGDGAGDQGDADLLYDLIDGVSVSERFIFLAGGLGSYRPTRYHGAFVHVDVRGHRARWGRYR